MAAGAGIVGVAGCNSAPPGASSSGSPGDRETDSTERTGGQTTAGDDGCSLEKSVVDVRGAIYLPARAYNIYQMWANYDREVIERDLGYADRLNLNAIRIWTDFEFWREEPAAHEKRLDHFLAAADDLDMQVLVGLFDHVGKEPTEENLHDTDPLTATATASPSKEIIRNRDRWDEPRKYVEWIMETYGDDERLLGISTMNEPGWDPAKVRFAKSMFETMKENRGSVKLTVGSTSMANNAEYMDWGIEALQFHYNFAPDAATYRKMLRGHKLIADQMEEPVWLSEWQRIRSGRGFTAKPPKDQRYPDYASLAPVIHEAGFGNFFWSLMLKPAYVASQRKNGILNGIFHEDGAVWSEEDAQAIKAMSGKPQLDVEERKEWPEWAMAVKKYAEE